MTKNTNEENVPSAFFLIPDDIIVYYIFPNVDTKIKMLLSKKYYRDYHNIHYKFSYKYLIFIVKNNITVCIDFLSNYENFDIYKREKIYYEKKTFFYVYDFCVYIAKKYKNLAYLEQFKKLKESIIDMNIDKNFSKLRIKQYKKFVDNNILWIK